MGHGVGVHEGLRTVEPVEGSDQGLEALALGCARPAPGSQSDPVTQAPAEREEIDLAFRAEFVGRGLDRQLHVAQIGGDVLAPEELVRQHPSAGEHLVRELAPEHSPVGHAFAGRLFREAVEGGDPEGREEEEVPVIATVHDEGVPIACASARQGRHRVFDDIVPGEPDPVAIAGNGSGLGSPTDCPEITRQPPAPAIAPSGVETSAGPAEMSTALAMAPRARNPAPTAKATANPWTTPAWEAAGP